MKRSCLSLLLLFALTLCCSGADFILPAKEWTVFRQVENFKISDDSASGRASGADPIIINRFTPVRAQDYRYIIFDMQSDSKNALRCAVYWKQTRYDYFAEPRSVKLPLCGDGKMHTYVIDLSKVKTWNGDIESIRLDPLNGPANGNTFTVKNFRFSSNAPEVDLVATNVIKPGDWRSFSGIAAYNATADSIKCKCSGKAAMQADIKATNPALLKLAELTLQVPAKKGLTARIYWKTDRLDYFADARSTVINLQSDGKMHTYKIDFGKLKNFNRKITGFMLVPITEAEKNTVFTLKNFSFPKAKLAGNLKITLPTGATSAEQSAAADLEYFLCRFLRDSLTVDGKIIRFISLNAADRNLPLEQWSIKSDGDTLHICGGRERGILYGVYHFLEDFCGVRWWTPDETFIPEPGKLSLPAINVSGKPKMFYRDIYRSEIASDKGLFFVRNRLNRDGAYHIDSIYGGELNYGGPNHCHTFRQYIKAAEFQKSHPEYFSIKDGQRRFNKHGQLCLANMEMRKTFVAKVLERIAADRKKAIAQKRSIPLLYDVSINDNFSPCECSECAKLHEKYGLSGTVLDFVNFVADEVKKDYPDIYITTLAYLYTEAPPKGGIKAKDNVIIKFCDSQTNMATGINSPENRKFKETLQSWSDCGGQLWIWDYGITYNFPELPFPSEQFYGELHREYFKNRVSGIFWEHEVSTFSDFYAMKVWLAAKLMEDPEQDFEALCDTFYNGYFGKAGKNIKKYRQLLAEAAVKNHSFVNWFALTEDFKYVDVETLLACFKTLDEGLEKIQNDPELLLRFNRAILGLSSLTGRFFDYYKSEFEKLHPGKKFPLTRTKIATPLKYVRDNSRNPNSKDVFNRLISIIENSPEKFTVDERFKNQEIIVEFYPTTFRLADSERTRVVKDAEALDNCAVKLRTKGRSYYKLPMEFGLYDLKNSILVSSTQLQKEDIPQDGKYHWYKIYSGMVNRYSYVYVNRAWTIQGRLNRNELTLPPIPIRSDFIGAEPLDASIFVRMKLTGPEFITESPDKENFIWVDRIVLVKNKPAGENKK